MEIILKPEEVAQVLRTDVAPIIELLESGKLAGFKVGNEWRIPETALTKYIVDAIHSQNVEALKQVFKDPSAFAAELSKPPDLQAHIESNEFEQGSFSAFLQDGLRQIEALKKAQNILKNRPIDPSDDRSPE